jgi:hypothetical protein
MEETVISNPAVHELIERFRRFAQQFVREHDALSSIVQHASVLLHGSTTLGILDAFSDIDVWVLVPDALAREFDRASPTRFINFSFDDRPGHFNLEPIELLDDRIDRCDFPLIGELRRAVVLQESVSKIGQKIVSRARQPMSDDLCRAWFRYHYTEMRSHHRAADTPIDRGDAIAMLQAVTSTLIHAMQAAMVLDGEPYPYSKWLGRACTETSTGSKIIPLVNEIIDLFGRGALRVPGPESQHPITLKLKEIRAELLTAAANARIDGPWLKEWWLHIPQSRQVIDEVRWPR